MMKQSVFANFNRSRALFAAGLLLMGIAVWQLCRIGFEYRQGTEHYEKIAEEAIRVSESQESETDAEDVQIDFEWLQSINPEITGWLRFDRNGINYPLLQGTDNEKYLDTLADGTKNKAGSIFLDALCSPDFSDSHTLIYGHNMRDQSMFGQLKKYETVDAYYEENTYFTVYTPENTYRYEIFAWYEVNEDDRVFQTGFAADDIFEEFVDDMLRRRYRDTGAEADREDKIVTLSTCSSAGKRFVVHAKRIISYVP